MFFWVFLLFSVVCCNLTSLVNVFVGTGGEGYGIGSTPPGAQRPFGLARVSPDTTDDFWIPFNHFGIN